MLLDKFLTLHASYCILLTNWFFLRGEGSCWKNLKFVGNDNFILKKMAEQDGKHGWDLNKSWKQTETHLNLLKICFLEEEMVWNNYTTTILKQEIGSS